MKKSAGKRISAVIASVAILLQNYTMLPAEAKADSTIKIETVNPVTDTEAVSQENDSNRIIDRGELFDGSYIFPKDFAPEELKLQMQKASESSYSANRAKHSAETVTGTCGEDITWSLDTSTGALTIIGTGEMEYSSYYYSDLPFYEYCDIITSVTIGEGVTSIGEYAFVQCEKLTAITIPESVTVIEGSAFEYCTSLTEIDLPDGLEYLGGEAFYGCSSLTSIDIPEKITEIPDDAFSGCSSLTTVNFSGTITSVGSWAFFNCTALDNITFSQGLLSIGAYAFCQCYALTEAILPEGIISIGSEAFQNCSSLSEVSIPSTVEEIGSSAFYNTPFIETFTSDLVVLADKFLYTYNGSSAEVTIPEGVTVICANAFSGNTELVSVTLPDSIESIEREVFSGCTALKEILNTDAVAYIGEGAFESTPYVSEFTDDLVIVGKCLYTYKGMDKEVIIPEGVISIAPYAFSFNSDIEWIELPESLTSIGSHAFLGCTSLTTVTVPPSVAEIGEYALGYYCDCVTFGNIVSYDMHILGYSETSAESYANTYGFIFAALDSMTNSCGENAVWSLDYETGVLTITGTGAMTDYYPSYYYGMEGCEVSPFYALKDCITEVKISEGITSVGRYAFDSCSSLTVVSLPSTLTTLGNGVFANCTQLKAVGIPDAVTKIGSYCFDSCISLEELTIPSGVSSINNITMYNCSGLKRIEVSAESSYFTSQDGVLYNADMTRLVMIPASTELKELILPETVTYIENYAGYKNVTLKKVIIPSELSYIGYYAFADCTNLESIVFSGAAPDIDLSEVGTNNLHIYYDGLQTGWADIIAGNESYVNLVWIDYSEYKGSNTLAISSEATAATAGDTIQLKALLDPFISTDFSWSSSNTSAAVVSGEGLVTAIAPGETIITCRTSDGAYSDEISITVTGEEFVMPQKALYELSSGEVDFSASTASYESRQIACEALNGIYFLNGNKLGFYSLANNTFEQIYSFYGTRSSYTANDKLYVLENDVCVVYDLISREIISEFIIKGYKLSAVGADNQGRIYLAVVSHYDSLDKKLILCAENGEIISETGFDYEVYSFSGFDSSNGNFYMECYYDMYSWGYSHPGHGLMMGNVTDNVIMNIKTYSSFAEGGIIARSLECIMYLCQNNYYEHTEGAALLGDRYLAATSVTLGMMSIFDSDDTGLANLMSVEREVPEYEISSTYYDTTSVGVRTVYSESSDGLIVYNNKTLTEYSTATWEAKGDYATEHYVFSLMKMGNSVIAVEKENDLYYLEIIGWETPEEITITAESSEMQVGQTQTLKADNGTSYSSDYMWTSSDSTVVSVDSNGVASAWRAGTAIITCTLDGLTSSITITVTETAEEAPLESINKVNGYASSNFRDNNYTLYGSVVNSYLYESEDGILTRVEYESGTGIIVEEYDTSYNLIDSRIITAELERFGGFYSGESYNYLVFGALNLEESDANEVMRVVKYSKEWERLGECSVYGANTTVPFDAGSLRMTETAGKLYIHTCHEMYTSDDGLNHQANMTFVIDEEAMTVTDSYYDVMNISYGYVSHSFNQFIETDGEHVYRVDHGDAHLRAVSITKFSSADSVTDVDYTAALEIQGAYGANSTGVSVGGFELSKDNCLIVGNSVDQSSAETYSSGGQRNIFLTVTDKDLLETKTIWLTEYNDSNGINTYTPHITKLDDDRFVIMWEEYNELTYQTTLRAVTVNGSGERTSGKEILRMSLSDCKPIYTSDNLVKWYTTDGESLVINSLNPYALSNGAVMLGDVNFDKAITPSDAALALSAYASSQTIGVSGLITEQITAADVNFDGKVTPVDSASILSYYAYVSTTTEEIKSLEDYLANQG